MNFILFSNNKLIASCANVSHHVDTFFVDLEILGKDARQGHTNSLISRHSLCDISLLRPLLDSKLLGVRTNPIHPNIKIEIEECLSRGADVLMLPMFYSADEVKYYLDCVDHRCQVDLLLETPESLRVVDQLPLSSVRFVHFGINDLSLAFKYPNLFYSYFNGLLHDACTCVYESSIPFGIGGIGSPSALPISPELIFSAAINLRASRFILSRNFLSAVLSNSACATTTFLDNENKLYSLYDHLVSSPDNVIDSNIQQLSSLLNNLFPVK